MIGDYVMSTDANTTIVQQAGSCYPGHYTPGYFIRYYYSFYQIHGSALNQKSFAYGKKADIAAGPPYLLHYCVTNYFCLHFIHSPCTIG